MQVDVENVAAIIPCHMYGLPAPMPEIVAWAHERGIFVIEDAALVLGGQVAGRPAGAWGDAAIFSFGLGKIVDNQVGGALVTDDEDLSAEINRILSHLPMWDDTLLELTNQWNNLYWAMHQHEDQNARLLSLYPQLFDIYRPLVAYQLPAAEWDGLPAELQRLDRNLTHRSEMANRYDERLRGLPLRTIQRPAGTYYWRYPLFVTPDQRNELLSHLWEQGIHDATRWYPSLRYMASALVYDVVQPPTPNADWLGASVINLPVDGTVDFADVDRTADIITDYFEDLN
jgi:dTDP-4-amino-4,6-dideoxygalactose transaminase